MKKRFFFFVTVLLCTLIVTSQGDFGDVTVTTAFDRLIHGLGEALRSLSLDFLDPLFDFLILHQTQTLQFFFGFILFLMTYSIIDMSQMMHDRRILTLVVSLGFTIISMIALGERLDLIIPVYTSMFSTIFSMIPLFILLVLSIKVKPLWVIRLLWIFMLVFFTISFLSLGIPSFSNGLYFQGSIFLFLMLFCLGILVFLRPIRHMFFKGEIDELVTKMKADMTIDSAVQKEHRREAEELRKGAQGLTGA